MALRGKQQVAKLVARQLSCRRSWNSSELHSYTYSGQPFPTFTDRRAFAPVRNTYPSTALAAIGRDLYRLHQIPIRRYGYWFSSRPNDDPETRRRREKAEDNARKYLGLLVATENFYGGEWKATDMIYYDPGVHRLHPSPDIVAAAEYALSYLNQQQREADNEIKLKQLIRANGQFLACTIYWLTMEASDCKFYEALVFVSNYEEGLKELIFIRPAKYYPEIPPHLHYLVGPPPGEEPLLLFESDCHPDWDVLNQVI